MIDITKKTLLLLLKNAKKLMKSNQNMFFPVFFPIKDNFLDPVAITFSNDIEKLKTFFAIGVYCKQLESKSVILGLNGCSRILKEKDCSYFSKNLSTERPTLYPKDFRNNYLILTYIDFLDIDNSQIMLCKYILKNNEIKFLRPQFLTFQKVNSVIISIIVKGWNSSNQQQDFEIN